MSGERNCMPNFPPISVLYVHKCFLGLMVFFSCLLLHTIPTVIKKVLIIPVISLQILMNVAPIMEDANTIVTILLVHLSATVTQATGWRRTG